MTSAGTENRGLFLTFEGGDGSGKSTQASLLERWLAEGGHSVVRTREPGGTAIGAHIRELVLHSREHIDPRAEALLYAADRAQNIATVVRPALQRGVVVIQDRYLDSSVAYQAAGRKLSGEHIRNLSLWAAEELLPDLTIVLDLDEESGRLRLDSADKPFDRLESEGTLFHRAVRQAYLALAKEEPHRFVVIDASLPVELIAQQVRDAVHPLLQGLPRREPSPGSER